MKYYLVSVMPCDFGKFNGTNDFGEISRDTQSATDIVIDIYTNILQIRGPMVL